MDEVLHNVMLAIWCNLLDPCWCTGHAGDQDSIGFLVLAGTVRLVFLFFFLWWFILLISWSHGWGDAFNSRCRSVRASGFFITWSASWKFCRFCDHVCWCGLFIQLNVIPVTMKEWKWRDGGGSPMWYAHVCRGRCNHALSVPMHMEACMLMAWIPVFLLGQWSCPPLLGLALGNSFLSAVCCWL